MLTQFGKEVRKARIESSKTMLSMAKELGVTASYLSALEMGKKKIPLEFAKKIETLFSNIEHKHNFVDLAQACNKNIVLEDEIPLDQRILVAGFARADMSTEDIKKAFDLLDDMGKGRG